LEYWSLRRAELCDPKLCPDAPEDGGPCASCPLNRLEAEHFQAGQLLRRALDLRAASRAGICVCLEDVASDEFQAMVVLEQEQEQWERERDSG
jgi:hypothetical protein